MTGNQRFGLATQLDVEQILIEAKSRWLRPAEICEILRNFQNFCIAPEPPNRPPSGSIFLFDRKILRYFRKDGYNWRKKKDGKTVKEAHERLKAGSVDVLHCYYAHGEENEKFQRRSYWMLEEKYMHIVLVHYREVKANKSSCTKGVEEIPHSVYDNSHVASNSLTNHNQITSQTTDANYPDSAQISGYEDSEIDNYQASSRYHPIPKMPQFDNSMMDASLLSSYFPVFHNTQGNSEGQGAVSSENSFYSLAQEDITKVFDETGHGITLNGTKSQMGLASLDEVLEHCNVEHQSHFPSTFCGNLESIPNRKNVMFNEVSTSKLSSGLEGAATARGHGNLQYHYPGVDSRVIPNMDMKKAADNEVNVEYSSILNQSSVNVHDTEGDESLKKYDSFSMWMSKELGEVDNSNMQSSSETYWDVADSEGVEDFSSSRQDDLYPYVLSPSLSQDQLFSIIDFSPNWAYSDMETKVLITGTFMMTKIEIERCKWSCMFGEVEVPADVLLDGILRCYTPPHKVGRVPFYVTCSNRLACSEVREFEYLVSHAQYMESSETYAGSKNEMFLHICLEELLSLGAYESPELKSCANYNKSLICNQISSLLLKSDERYTVLKETTETEFSSTTLKDELMQKLLKEKLHAWLLCKVVEDGKGPNILDKEGQGVIHLAAGLGYDWAIKPIVLAGVNINFRDTRGWSALHWAAYFGRERTVAMLISLDAAPGALTDPTPEFPNGKTPADLASSNGHKGIAGYLAESSLTTHLSVLTLRDSPQIESICIKDTKERHANKFDEGAVQTGSSLEDSLSAVRVATLAAASIHQVFRVQSFHRKKLVECGNTKFGMSDEHALSLVSIKSNKTGHPNEPVHAAAIRIQNTFRGWKGKKEFTVIRQHIVKIQAHVRGHQVRKHFRKVVWSVGIVEKVILRWRRKGSGLRGFRSNALTESSNIKKKPRDNGVEEEDYDFLREGRKQTEQRMDRALSRVKSMVQYPKARDQYQRLLVGVEELKESKEALDGILKEADRTDDRMMFDLEELLGEQDVPMSPA